MRCAVVLAGGSSRRFGADHADKLDALVGRHRLLERVIVTLPNDVALVVVGPSRPLPRPARLVREDPPGGGPAAALVAGLRAALDTSAQTILVLPGDAPDAGPSALVLADELERGSAQAVVAVDATGRLQPLQLALTTDTAAQLIRLAGPTAGHGASARSLVTALQPPPVPFPLPPAGLFDIDTEDQLVVYRLSRSPAVAAVLELIGAPIPTVLAIDGPSGAGKSTLAAAIALRRDATVIDGDDFYSPSLPHLGENERSRLTDTEVADRVIDWRRLRHEVLGPLRRGAAVRYRPYDWAADDGRLGTEKLLQPSELLILEGVYSARPELADLVDVTVYVGAEEHARQLRLSGRGERAEWAAFWERGERRYFGAVRPRESFDLDLQPEQLRNDGDA